MTGTGNRETATDRRLMSVDVLRGCAVMGMILANSAAILKDVADVKVFDALLHAHWDGLKFADLVFPMFLMMVGVSIPLALSGAKATTGLHGREAKHILWRSIRLIVLGIILTNLDWFSGSEETWRLWDALQRIGLVYGICAVLFLRCGPGTLAWLIAAILLFYWLLCILPSLGGLPTDLHRPGHNFPASVDRAMLGAGNHLCVTGPEGYDPEGLLGTIPGVAHGLIGVLVGEFIRKHRGRNDILRLAGAGGLMVLAGVAWGLVFPIVKDIWSSSFVLVTCGVATLLLSALHALLDNGTKWKGVPGLLVQVSLTFGMNAIAAYVLHEVASSMLGWRMILDLVEQATPAIGNPAAALIPSILFLSFIWLCMDYLRRKNWIIKI